MPMNSTLIGGLLVRDLGERRVRRLSSEASLASYGFNRSYQAAGYASQNAGGGNPRPVSLGNDVPSAHRGAASRGATGRSADAPHLLGLATLQQPLKEQPEHFAQRVGPSHGRTRQK